MDSSWLPIVQTIKRLTSVSMQKPITLDFGVTVAECKLSCLQTHDIRAHGVNRYGQIKRRADILKGLLVLVVVVSHTDPPMN